MKHRAAYEHRSLELIRLILMSSMESQTHMEATHRGVQQRRSKEPMEKLTEEQFLKDLYLFMKKRDTPIERIPHLGFKQIDLFVMFKTVRDFGGYQQVTMQQLWKQVYNTLGGNPRSTSAATCTRRHYEKLLLPYECHRKGIMMSSVPLHPPKLYHYTTYSKGDNDSPRPAKRKLLHPPLHQSSHSLQSDLYPLTLHHPHYYHPSHAVLPSYLQMSPSVLTSHSPPMAQSQYAFLSSGLNPAERVKEPLEQLRYLAEQYKCSSGLQEPLNLSVKASSQMTHSKPTSSFTPPTSGKNPKFLNTPSPLYTARYPRVVRDEGGETKDDGASAEVPVHHSRAREGFVIDRRSKTAPGSTDCPPALMIDESSPTMTQPLSLPKTEDQEGSPEVKRLHLSHMQPRPPQQNKMEIEIPLSVFHNWLRMYGPQAMMHRAKQAAPHIPEEFSGLQSSNKDIVPSNLTFHGPAQRRSCSPAAEDLRWRNAPSPTSTVPTADDQHNTSQQHFTSHKPSSGFLKTAASQDVCLFDQLDVNESHSSKAPKSWNTFDQGTRGPFAVPQDLTVPKPSNEVPDQGGTKAPETRPSAVLTLNSGSASVLQLTSEEVMKLKRIILSSL
ncbi:AT-rich interaction domain 6 isoform 2-T2 [Aulostomus maculatus]